MNFDFEPQNGEKLHKVDEVLYYIQTRNEFCYMFGTHVVYHHLTSYLRH